MKRVHRTGSIVSLALAIGLTPGCADRRGVGPTAAGKPAAVAQPLRVPPMGTAKFRVCGFGFHTPTELDAIKAALPAADFVFTDLTPPGDPAQALSSFQESDSPAPVGSPPAWLIDRCRPDLRCDMTVFSGEFAGGFFGKYGTALKLHEMEEASCQSRCQGLFHSPREVFLMACNTLATKSADDRTPDEYLRVLLAHGFSRADAERVVDLRYGPLGPSFKESLRRVFMGVPRVYGFSSVAPKGEVTAPLLHEYFQKKGDYAAYLAQAGRDNSSNKELLEAFDRTSLVQTTGLARHEPVAGDRDMVCRLYDDGQPVTRRLGIAHQLFARPDFLSFVPTIEIFLSRHPPGEFAGEEHRAFKQIQSLAAPRQEIRRLLGELHVTTMKIQMANLAFQLEWIGGDEFRRMAVADAKQLLAEPVSAELAEIGCELTKYVPAGAGLRSEEIPDHFFLHWEGYRLLDCLAPSDGRITARMLEGLRDIDESVRIWAAHALSRRSLDDKVLVTLARSLKDPSPGVRIRVRWTLTNQKSLSPAVLAVARERDPELAASLAKQQAQLR